MEPYAFSAKLITKSESTNTATKKININLGEVDKKLRKKLAQFIKRV
jgi:hypothetical protein